MKFLKSAISTSLVLMTAGYPSVWAATETCLNYSYTGSPEVLVLPPVISTIRVTATGADGGTALANNGGSGATVSGTLAVNASSVVNNGDTITIIIGQVGQDGDVKAGAENQVEAGGGGGSGVVFGITPLLIAGAGGGGDNTGAGGGATIPGTTSSGASNGGNAGTATSGGAGGTGGNGGVGGNDSPKPGNGGGGGFITDGGTGLAAMGAATGGGACISGGLPTGGAGGAPSNEELGNGSTGELGVAGGFGCGGGGGAGHRESGGGGGYNGGGGGGASGFPGGGGSYLDSTTTSINNTAGVNAGGTASNGSAQICYDVPDADLSVTKSDSNTTYTPGEAFVYTITVNNAGPDGANGSLLSDNIPTWAISPEWECTGTTGGAICPSPTTGSGNLNETIATFPANSSVTFEITGTYSTNMNDY